METDEAPRDYESDKDLFEDCAERFLALPRPRSVLVVPPDATRPRSRAAIMLRAAYRAFGSAVKAVIPATGTHVAMDREEIERFFAGTPSGLFLPHDHVRDTASIGEVPGDKVGEITSGAWSKPWRCEVARELLNGHDLVVSLGQVVPHEVAGMANYTKNIVIGLGGERAIADSHWIGALHGIERTMGEIDTPVRALFDVAQRDFLDRRVPVFYALTVIGPDGAGGDRCRGLFTGFGRDAFEKAAALSRAINVQLLAKPLETCVARMDSCYRSTWLANKAIYRLRRAMADGSHLVVVAPGVRRFGESDRVDAMIRRYGYRGTEAVRDDVDRGGPLSRSLAAAAHLVHGSTDGRFRVTYATDGLSREEIEGAGYGWMSIEEAQTRYPETVAESGGEGWREGPDGPYYEVGEPAAGLWIATA